MPYVHNRKFTFISVASAFVFGGIIGFVFGLIPFARQVERIEIAADYHRLHLDRAITCERSLFTCLQALQRNITQDDVWQDVGLLDPHSPYMLEK